MTSKCYKSVSKPHSYIKTSKNAYWSIMPLGNNFSVSYFGRTFINFHHEVYTETTEEEVDEIFDTFLSKKMDVDISFQKDLPTKRINACLEATSKFI